MTQKLDISFHAIERFQSRIDRSATKEQAIRAIREAWRGARRLHRHSGDRVLYEANGGAFRLSVAERPHGRMAILSVLPGNEEEDTAEEIVLEPTPPPSRPRVLDVANGWKYKTRKNQPEQQKPPDPPQPKVPVNNNEKELIESVRKKFVPPLSLEEAIERRSQTIARLAALKIKRSASVGADAQRLYAEQAREEAQCKFIKEWIHDEHVMVAHRLSCSNIYSAWRLLLQCKPHVPDELKQLIEQDVPDNFDPDKDWEEDEID